MPEIRKAGYYKLEEFAVYSYDLSMYLNLSHIIHTFAINESMNNGSVRGYAVVYDAGDALGSVPLKGEEFVKIVYKDYYDRERTEYGFVYSVSELEYSNDDAGGQAIMKYRINFVSIQKFYSDMYGISRAFRDDQISNYVKTIFDEFYIVPYRPGSSSFRNYGRGGQWSGAEKMIEVQPTDGVATYIVPDYSPEEALHFFARKAYTTDDQYTSFRFFENREKYYFATNEQMFKWSLVKFDQKRLSNQPFLYTRSSMTDITPERQITLQNELISIDLGDWVNSARDLNNGAYYRNTRELDLIHATVADNPYEFHSEFGQNVESIATYLRTKHSSRFIRDRLQNEQTRIVVKDYASAGMPAGTIGLRADTRYPEIYNQKGAYFYHYMENMIGVSIYGRNDLFAGDVIELDLLVQQSQADGSNPRKDAERSGKYLVEQVNSIFYEDSFIQKLKLSRVGIGDKY